MASVTINFQRVSSFTNTGFLSTNARPDAKRATNNTTLSFSYAEFQDASEVSTTLSFSDEMSGTLPSGDGPIFRQSQNRLETRGVYISNSAGGAWESGKGVFGNQQSAEANNYIGGQRNTYNGFVQPYAVSFIIESAPSDPSNLPKFSLTPPSRSYSPNVQYYGYLSKVNDLNIGEGGFDYFLGDNVGIAANIGTLEIQINSGGWGAIGATSSAQLVGKRGWNLIEMKSENGWGLVAQRWEWVYYNPLSPPTANFTFSDTYSNSENEDDAGKFSFDGSSSTDSDGTIVLYSWGFGDGQTASVNSPLTQHVYAPREGDLERTFNVTLTVTDNDRLTGTVTKPITVKDVEIGAQIDALVLADGRVVTCAQDGKDVLTRVLYPTDSGLKKLEESRVTGAKLGALAAKPDATLVRTLRRTTAIEMETSKDGGKTWQ